MAGRHSLRERDLQKVGHHLRHLLPQWIFDNEDDDQAGEDDNGDEHEDDSEAQNATRSKMTRTPEVRTTSR